MYRIATVHKRAEEVKSISLERSQRQTPGSQDYPRQLSPVGQTLTRVLQPHHAQSSPEDEQHSEQEHTSCRHTLRAPGKFASMQAMVARHHPACKAEERLWSSTSCATIRTYRKASSLDCSCRAANTKNSRKQGCQCPEPGRLARTEECTKFLSGKLLSFAHNQQVFQYRQIWSGQRSLDHTGCRLSMNAPVKMRYESHACVRQIIMSSEYWGI